MLPLLVYIILGFSFSLTESVTVHRFREAQEMTKVNDCSSSCPSPPCSCILQSPILQVQNKETPPKVYMEPSHDIEKILTSEMDAQRADDELENIEEAKSAGVEEGIHEADQEANDEEELNANNDAESIEENMDEERDHLERNLQLRHDMKEEELKNKLDGSDEEMEEEAANIPLNVEDRDVENALEAAENAIEEEHDIQDEENNAVSSLKAKSENVNSSTALDEFGKTSCEEANHDAELLRAEAEKLKTAMLRHTNSNAHTETSQEINSAEQLVRKLS